MFNWEEMETTEYSRSTQPSYIKLTERGYLTATGKAIEGVTDSTFLVKADAVMTLAQLISQGTAAGIHIPGFKAYHPYPLQAVWRGSQFKIWLKQPLFINETVYQAALTRADLLQTVNFEQLAEGTEIQMVTTGPVNQVVVNELHKTLQTAGYESADPLSHREVYLDGLPLTDEKQVLVRVALAASGKQPPLAIIN